MEFTGERMIPEYNNENIIYSEHLLRYNFAKQFVENKLVLDVAAGSGYGTKILSEGGAKQVTGVDISEEAVAYAKKNYASKNTDFIVADGTNLPFDDKKFDIVVSFETIEHLENHIEFVKQLHRVIKLDGTLVISSPNKDIYPQGNEFHFKEFTKKEFVDILKKYFKNIKIYNQNNFLVSSLFEDINSISSSANEVINDVKQNGMYFVAVCSNDKLPEIKTKNLIASPSEISSQSIVHEREKHIKILQKETEELKRHIEYFKNNPEFKEKLRELEIQLDRHKIELSAELSKNEYLYNTVKEDNKRFDDIIKLLNDKENSHKTIIDENSDYKIQLATIQKELKERIVDFNKVQNEKNEILKQLDYLNDLEVKYKEERDKAEYLYRVSLEREAQLEVNKEVLEDLEIERNDFFQKIQELKEFENLFVQEKDKSESLYHELLNKKEELSNLEKNISELNIKLETLTEYEHLFFQEKEKTDYLNKVLQERLNELSEYKILLQKIEEEKLSLINNLEKLKSIEQLYVQEQNKAEFLYQLSLENKNTIQLINKDNSELKESILKLNSVKEELEYRQDKFYKDNIELVTSLNILLEENKNLKQTQFTLNEVKDNLLDRLNILSNEKNEISQILILEQIKSNNFEEKCKDFESTKLLLSKKSEDLLQYVQDITKIQNELFECRLKNLKQEENKELLEKKYSELNAEYTNINASNLLIKETLNSVEAELIEKNRVLCEYEQVITINNEKIHNLEDLIKNADNEKNEYLGIIDTLTSKIHLLSSQIEQTNSDLNSVRKSLSWKITTPLRLLFDLFLFIIKPFKNLLRDSRYAYELLLREGIKSFFYRFFWYFRGKRLNEEIQYVKNKKQFILQSNSIGEKTQIKFERFKKPDVSIIIPVFNQWEYTYNCLNSIYENTKDISYEIIVADDVSEDETKNISEIIKNIKIVRNKENLRFLLNCNNAAKRASGKYVLFLNNDTTVHNDWLKYMLSVFEKYDNVGAVGSKLIYEDGRLQEAGGIMWDDASGWNFGRLADPEMPEYNYLKETDYVSGACLMIPTKLWKEIGGFDTHFVPAYYEDTDICFEIRKRGYKVIYQPKSVVTHYEGISNGKDETSGQKKYQVTNHKKFFEKWKSELQTFHFKNAENVFLARERSRNKKQVLVIDHYVPHFDKDAGSRSTFSYLKLLVKMGCNVKFIGDNFFKHEPYTSELEQMGIEVLYGNYYYNNIKEWIKENGKYFDYVFAHRIHIAPKYFADLKKYSKAKIIYVGHDLQFIKSKKEYEFTKDKEHLKSYEKYKEIETQIFNTVDIIYPFSTYEAPLIQELVPHKIVRAIPVYFFDNEYIPQTEFSKKKDILFVGGFGHPPNIDGVMWFAKKIFPKVLKEIPDIKFHIVGSNPTEEILALKSDSINVTGFVSDDELKMYYENCRVAVLPLRVGAGVKGKLLESLYYKVPCVITSVAAEGVPDIEKNCLVSDNISIFAESIVRIYTNFKLWNNFSLSGSNLISEYYSEVSAQNILLKDIN